MIGFLHPEPSPPPPVANPQSQCVISTLLPPPNGVLPPPLASSSHLSMPPHCSHCYWTPLKVLRAQIARLPPWQEITRLFALLIVACHRGIAKPHPSSYFAGIFQPSTFGMAPLPKTYHSCHSPGCQIGLLSNFTRAGLHAAKYFKDQTRNTNTLEWLPPNNVPLQSLLHVNIILCLPHRARDSTNPTDTATRFTP